MLMWRKRRAPSHCHRQTEHSFAIAPSLWCIMASYSAKTMQTTQESLITDKTRELCQAILDQPEMRAARQRIQTFVADDKARAQYEGLMAKGQTLQQKQQSSQLTAEEISAFEKD